MPWYYASREAKPAGPVTLDELHALRAGGAILPETYVIEHTGEPGAIPAWKKYGEVFPLGIPTTSPVMPPAPPIPPVALPATPHPLFPSAAAPSVLPPPGIPVNTQAGSYPPVKPTNPWCAWGFGLGLAGFFFSFACGIGSLLALPGLLVSGYGLAQVNRKPEQAGRNLAFAGLALAVLALLISLAFAAICIGMPLLKGHELTVTEESTNDSE